MYQDINYKINDSIKNLKLFIKNNKKNITNIIDNDKIYIIKKIIKKLLKKIRTNGNYYKYSKKLNDTLSTIHYNKEIDNINEINNYIEDENNVLFEKMKNKIIKIIVLVKIKYSKE